MPTTPTIPRPARCAGITLIHLATNVSRLLSGINLFKWGVSLVMTAMGCRAANAAQLAAKAVA